MFAKRYLALPAALIAGPLLTGCVELTLPRFDGGVLNPEIRFLRAGEIMECVKCAMVAFMHEREVSLLKDREEVPRVLAKQGLDKCPDPKEEAKLPIEKRTYVPLCQIEGADFAPYHFNVKKSVHQSFEKKYRDCGHQKHLSWENNKAAKKGEEWQLKCVPNNCDAQLDHRRMGDRDYRMGASIWDYELSFTSNSIKERGCIQVPDYSRFALDPNQTGTIQLTLLGVNSGFINYARIDAVRTPFYPFITAGNSAAGAPFPQLLIAPKASTTFDMSVVMPQSIHTYQQSSVPSDRIIERPPSVYVSPRGLPRDSPLDLDDRQAPPPPSKEEAELIGLLTRLRVARNQVVRCPKAGDCAYSTKQPDATVKALRWKSTREEWKYEKNDPCPRAKELASNALESYKSRVEFACEIFENKLYRLAAQLPDDRKEPEPLANEFYRKCHADTSTFHVDDTSGIDFLALKQMLHNVVEKQEKAVHRGIPDMTLSSLTMTSAFQISMEAQAGTRHFFRILPLLAPPNTDVKLDHTHTLKIALNGKKGKGDKQSAKRLTESCRERVRSQSTPGTGPNGNAPDPCSTEYGQLLEGIIQALERAGGSSQ